MNLTSIRRKAIEEKLQENELCLAVSHFPLMGCPNTIYPYNTVRTIDACNSKFTCDEVINQHFRFGYVHFRSSGFTFRTLTKNIRMRKGRNVEINMPLFKDTKTPKLTYKDLFPNLRMVQLPSQLLNPISGG